MRNGPGRNQRAPQWDAAPPLLSPTAWPPHYRDPAAARAKHALERRAPAPGSGPSAPMPPVRRDLRAIAFRLVRAARLLRHSGAATSPRRPSRPAPLCSAAPGRAPGHTSPSRRRTLSASQRAAQSISGIRDSWDRASAAVHKVSVRRRIPDGRSDCGPTSLRPAPALPYRLLRSKPLACRTGASHALPQQPLQPGNEFHGAERLDDVIVRTQPKAPDHVGFLLARRQKNHPDIARQRIVTQAGKYFVTALAGHVDIQNRQVGRPASDQFERSTAIARHTAFQSCVL